MKNYKAKEQMDLLLLIGGLGWAVIGFANVIVGAQGGHSEAWMAANMLFNSVVFVIPGLLLAGWGSALRARRNKPGAQ